MTVTPELAAAEHKAQPMSNAHCRFAPASRHHWDRVDSFSQRAGGTAHEDSTGLQQRRASLIESRLVQAGRRSTWPTAWL